MPPLRNVNSDFMRQVFRGDKRLLRKSEIRTVGKTYCFKNLSTQRVLEKLPDQSLEEKHLPDITNVSKIDRKFVMIVRLKDFKTLRPGYINKLFKHELTMRNKGQTDEDKYIEIHHEFSDFLNAELFPVGSSRFVSMLRKK